jgi:acyl-CoA thioesterase-1
MVSKRARVAVWVMAAVVVGGCAPRETAGPEKAGASHGAANAPSGAANAPSGAANAPSSVRTPAETGPRIVVLGDSLTAGLGLGADDAYPALLQQRLDAAGLKYHVVNAGVSGDTSAGGLSRLDWALEGDVKVLIVALGGNDALRGLPIEELRHNLSAIIERAQARGIAVIVAGMEAPPNFGRSYIVEFHEVYPELAKQYDVALLPFLLDGVAGVESLNQRDGIHPTAEGARLVANNVWAVLRPILDERSGRK